MKILALVLCLLISFEFSWFTATPAAAQATTKMGRVLGDDLAAYLGESSEIKIKDNKGKMNASTDVLTGTVVGKTFSKEGAGFIKCILTGGSKLSELLGDNKNVRDQLKLKDGKIVSGKILSCDKDGIDFDDDWMPDGAHTINKTRWPWGAVSEFKSPHFAYIITHCPDRIANTDAPDMVRVMFTGCGDIYATPGVELTPLDPNSPGKGGRDGIAIECKLKVGALNVKAPLPLKEVSTPKNFWGDPADKHRFTSAKACDPNDTVKVTVTPVNEGFTAEDWKNFEPEIQKVRESTIKGVKKPPDGGKKPPPGPEGGVEIKLPPPPLKNVRTGGGANSTPFPPDGVPANPYDVLVDPNAHPAVFTWIMAMKLAEENKIPPAPVPCDPCPTPYIPEENEGGAEKKNPPKPPKLGVEPEGTYVPKTDYPPKKFPVCDPCPTPYTPERKDGEPAEKTDTVLTPFYNSTVTNPLLNTPGDPIPPLDPGSPNIVYVPVLPPLTPTHGLIRVPVDHLRVTDTVERSCEKGELEVVKISSDDDPLNCQLTLKNLTNKPLETILPAFSCFVSRNPAEHQHLMKGADPLIRLGPGETNTFNIDTYCVSTKSIKPPPPSGAQYVAGRHPDLEAFKMLPKIVYCAAKLDAEKKLESTPIAPAMRARKVAQTAIWLYLGARSGKKGDLVTVESVKKDLLDGMPNGKSLSKEKLEKVEQFARAIFDAASLAIEQASALK